MSIISKGKVFSFYIEELSKYGLIQIINCIDGLVNIRVFYYPTDDLSFENIEKIVNSKDFYYIRHFFEFQFKKATNDLGVFAIPDFVRFPKYMRCNERKRNKDLIWFLVDIESTGKEFVVKTFKKYDDSLKCYSPSDHWGIEGIINMWIEGFTLEKWNDEFENSLYYKWLEKYYPDEIDSKIFFKKDQLLKMKPTNSWKKEEYIAKEIIEKTDERFDLFINALCKKNLSQEKVNLEIEKMIVFLNKLNMKQNFIETEESEQIVDFINKVLESFQYDDESDIIDSLRSW